MTILCSEALAAGIRERGYVIIDDALPADMVAALRQAGETHLAHQAHVAGIGRRQQHVVNPDIRGDRICWLEHDDLASTAYLSLMEQLRQALNEALFLGLFTYEAHYACYAPGAFYQRHRDAFQGARNRILSTVFYLNADWPEEAGGELVLYADDEHTILERVRPRFNRMVCFLSEQFPHEVLPATATRYSIAGWFRSAPR